VGGSGPPRYAVMLAARLDERKSAKMRVVSVQKGP
jgi:hypothetical protein